ncbi:MAG: capsid assembly protein [Alphaproteobacteria bacterium]
MTENLLNADVPEKFRNTETGEVNLEALLSSYSELEKKLSQGPSVPKSARDYKIDVSHGLFDVDDDVNDRLHKCGCTAEQAQEIYNLAAEKLVPMIMGMRSEFEADREVEKLVNHFGGVEKWKEMSRQLLAFGQKNMALDVLENLSSSYEGVLALHRMMKSDEPGLRRDADSGSGLDEKELQTMMRDPKYWRDKDPAFVGRVTEGFKKMYS